MEYIWLDNKSTVLPTQWKIPVISLTALVIVLGSVYYALNHAGFSPLSYIPSTESMHDWLLANGYELIAENTEWPMQAYNVIIWGRKGDSAGAGGPYCIAVVVRTRLSARLDLEEAMVQLVCDYREP